MLREKMLLLWLSPIYTMEIRKGIKPNRVKEALQLFNGNFWIQVLSGCDCCVVDGKLVEDKYTWIKENTTYGETKNIEIVLLLHC